MTNHSLAPLWVLAAYERSQVAYIFGSNLKHATKLPVYDLFMDLGLKILPVLSDLSCFMMTKVACQLSCLPSFQRI